MCGAIFVASLGLQFSSPIPAAAYTLFPWNTHSERWNVARFAEVSVFASDNRHLASYNFLKATSKNTKRREVAAHGSFSCGGPTGLEPSISGVIGRGSRVMERKRLRAVG